MTKTCLHHIHHAIQLIYKSVALISITLGLHTIREIEDIVENFINGMKFQKCLFKIKDVYTSNCTKYTMFQHTQSDQVNNNQIPMKSKTHMESKLLHS